MNEEVFWSGCLAKWIKDLLAGEEPLIPINSLQNGNSIDNKFNNKNGKSTLEIQYQDLCEGFLLNLVYFYADSDSIDFNLLNNSNLETRDFTTRLKYFKVLLSNLYQFYKNRLGKVIVMSLPDLISIARNPSTEQSGHEMNKVLLLLLGCAVQSERKEDFIERIKAMSLDLQNALVLEIKKITDHGEYTMDLGSLQMSNDEENFYMLIQNFHKIMKERDSYAKTLIDLAHEMESDNIPSNNTVISGNALTNSSSSSSSSYNSVKNINELFDHRNVRTPSPTAFERHENLKITALNEEIRKLRDQIDEKEDCIISLNNNLQTKSKELEKHKEERLKLLKDANAANHYKDEYDCLKHKVSNMEKLEKDYENLKNMKDEYEFYKNRVEKLENDISIKDGTIEELMKKEIQLNKKAHQLKIVEKRLTEQDAMNKELQYELDKEKTIKDEHIIEIGKLERMVDTLKQHCTDMERQLETNNANTSIQNQSFNLAAQIEECNRSEILELQYENQKLKNQLENTLDNENETNIHFEIRYQLEDKVEKLKKELDEKDTLLNETKKALDDEQIQKDHFIKQVNELNADKNVLTKMLEETKNQLDEIKTRLNSETEIIISKENVELKNVIEEKERVIKDIKNEKKQIEELLEEIKDEKKRQRNEINDSQQIIDSMAIENSNMLREKRMIENERNILKEKLERSEGKINDLNMKVIEIDNLTRKIKVIEQSLSEKCSYLSDAEAENDSLRIQIQSDNTKMKKLRTDLENEKNKISDLMSRLRSVLTTMKINGEQFLGTEMNKNLENICNKDDSDLINAIDSVFMKSFNAARIQADTLRVERQIQIDELDFLKKDIESLRKAGNDIPCVDDEKDILIKENKENKERIFKLESKITQLKALEENNKINLKKIKDLENEKTSLNVKLENMMSNNEVLNSELQMLKSQIHTISSEKIDSIKKLRDIEENYQNLVRDYDSLHNIHDSLVNDYDMRRSEIGHLKSQLKSDSEFYELQTNLEQCFKENRNLKEELYEERSINAQTLRQLTAQQNENGKIKKELMEIKVQFEHLKDEQERTSRNEPLMLKMNASLGSQIEQLNSVLARRDQEIAELREELKKIRNLFEKERNMLSEMCDRLQRENRELIQRHINDKDTFFAKNQEYQEQIENLRRNKEKLEEKIFDRYKNLENKTLQKEKPNIMSRTIKSFTGRSPTRNLKQKLPNIIPSSSSEDCGSSTNSNEETLTPPVMSAKLTHHQNGQLFKPKNYLSPNHNSKSDVLTSDSNCLHYSDKSNDDTLDVGNDSGVYLHSYSDSNYHSYSSSSSSTPDQLKMMSARDKSSSFKFARNPKSLHETMDNTNNDKKIIALSVIESRNQENIYYPRIQHNLHENYNLMNNSNIKRESCTVEDISFIEMKKKSFERQSLTTRSLRYLKSPIERLPSKKIPNVKTSVITNGAKGLACCLIPINKKAIKNDNEIYKPNMDEKVITNNYNETNVDSKMLPDSKNLSLSRRHDNQYNCEFVLNGVGTCSSSDGDTNSVEYETIGFAKTIGIKKSSSDVNSTNKNVLNHIRYRNGYIENYSQNTTREIHLSHETYMDQEVANINKNCDKIELPVQYYPHTPTMTSQSTIPFQYRTGSLRQPSIKNKELPPPYGKKPPSYNQYQQQTNSRTGTPNLKMKHFKPKATSTPKAENDTSHLYNVQIPKEGERRQLVRENDKALSVYENVEMESSNPYCSDTNNSENKCEEEKWQNYGCL
uniref:HOOK_N domain-containing protein n=1 Tax=Parastrongyloides trichosuri TaxID=131310 RepID=A0A0N4ZTK6_PARTI